MSFDFGNLAGIGVSAATGNPVGVGLGVLGLGMSIFGGIEQSHVAKQQAQVSSDIASQEMGINNEKQKAMELAGRRQQLEIIRNGQRARALAENNATNAGSQFGSGLQGGLAQVTDQQNFDLFGVTSALETGRAIAGYNNKISQDKIQLASLGGDAASAAGISSLGGSILKVSGTVGGFFGGGTSSGGNYSGTPGASNTGGLY